MSGSERTQEPGAAQRLDEVSLALADLARVLENEEDLGRVLQRTVGQVTAAIPGADMASVSALGPDGPWTVAASSDRVLAVDDDQYAAGDGPCLEAARTGRVVRVAVREAHARWPAFARAAAAAGVASYLSGPLLVDGEFAGSLNLYSEQDHGFGELDEALLRLYVTAATAAIASTRRYADARRLAGQLRQALDSRAVIDQAIGVLIGASGISAEQAFAELSRQSQNTNTKLREIAAAVVEHARRQRP